MATITGSTTIFLAPYCFSLSAMTSMSPVEETMPVFTASGKMSVNTQSSWLARNSGVDSSTPATPVVFWAVRAVTALMAYTPLAVMVLMSAWMPAPPLIASGDRQCCLHIHASFLSDRIALKFSNAAEGGAPDPPPGTPVTGRSGRRGP